MLRRIAAVCAALLLAAVVHAQTLVVYPLESPNSLMGTLVSDIVAQAFEEELESYGPATAPSLVPPLPVGEGFLNPTEYLQGRGVADRVGSALLRDALGADAVLTGTIDFEDQRLVARVNLARESGVDGFLVTAPQEEPGRLARGLVRAVSARLGVDAPLPGRGLDMSGPDGEVAQALTLLAAGLTEDARRVLQSSAQPSPRAGELLSAIQAYQEGAEPVDPALEAVMALNQQPLDERDALERFDLLADGRELPAARLWSAVLQASLGDSEGARESFGMLPQEFHYGRVAFEAFRQGQGDEAAQDVLERALDSEDVAALLGVATVAGNVGDVELEKEALTRLTRVSPFFPYPFERLSFIAFDEGDGLAAAQALVVAVQLDPQSDLYWTNLGWAYYLLDFLERSEQASRRAIELDPGQYIAHYNLGLVLAVTGRLESANESYLQALRIDPEVDDAAIEDLENALELYPDQPAVHYALAVLYEAEGRRAEAAEQYRLYARDGENADFVSRSQERAETLSAPPPPVEITNGIVTVSLGVRGIDAAPFHPGDPLYPSFEVYTPGDELPRVVTVRYEFSGPSEEQVLSHEDEVEVPRSAVALVVDDIELRLPTDLEAGIYRLDVEVSASEGRSASASHMFEVAGEPQRLRQLLGLNVTMQALDSGLMLYGPTDLTQPEILARRLLAELQSSASRAEEALPPITEGRFEGMSGGELFEQSTREDVLDFVDYLLASGARDTSLVFVEAYAEWALQGAPASAGD